MKKVSQDITDSSNVTHYPLIQNIIFLLKDIWKYHKLLFCYMVIEGLCSVLTPFLGIFLPKMAVELVTEGASTNKIIFSLGLFVLILAGCFAIQNMSNQAKYIRYNDMRSIYMRDIFYTGLDCDYSRIESAKGQTLYQNAFHTLDKGDWSGTSKMVVSIMAMFMSIINFILYSGVIAVLNPIILVFLVLMSAVNYFALRSARIYEENNRMQIAEYEKKINYVEWTAKDVKAGKDIRLYHMERWFVTVRDQLLSAYIKLVYKIKTRHFRSSVINALTLALRDGLAYVYLIYSVYHDKISIGDFILFFGAITGFSHWITNIVGQINEMNDANQQINDLRVFLDGEDSSDPVAPTHIPDLDSQLMIEFKNVSFSYEKDKEKIINNFNLTIKPGQKIALVGVNGAGKTTIVKLLCGFYKPDSGEILMNGTNINRYKKKELYQLFSAVFQDVTILPVTIAENISMKCRKETNSERVWDCLDKVGLKQEVLKYKKELDAPMLKVMEDDGIVLSGGQQQKLLMARALYKDAPILLLDEPTAALDPIAESETYERFHQLSLKKTAIYISHRLASTRFCDCIVLMKDGRIIESGTHDQLMEAGGEYAHMYEIQSHYYKKTDSKEGQEDEESIYEFA